MRTKLFFKKICICLIAAYAFCGLSSCYKNKYGNPAPAASDKWTKLNVPNGGITALEVADQTIYAGAGNTFYVSTDEGVTWTSSKVGTPGPADITAIKAFNNTIYAGTSRAGVFRSTDNGKTWTNNDAALFENSVSSFAVRDNNLYVGSDGDGVFVLNPALDRWESFSNNLPRPFTSYHIFKIVNTGNTLAAAAGVNSTFYHYDFNNSQWVESRLPKISSYIIDMIYDNGTIIGVSTGQKMIRSENNGIDWVYDTLDLQGASGAINNEKLYTGSLSYYVLTNMISGGWIQKRDKTAAAGSSWANGEEFLPNTQLSGIAELNNKLFLATNNGLYIKKL